MTATAKRLTIYINIAPQGTEAPNPLLDAPRWVALGFSREGRLKDGAPDQNRLRAPSRTFCIL